jgi:tetratricopeptide (TPR) repeat protein
VKRKVYHAILVGALCCSAWVSSAADKPSDNFPISSSSETNSDQVLRAYLQLQEQLHSALLAIEQTKQQTDEAAKKNAEMIAARLTMIEQALTGQNKREAEELRKSYKTSMTIAGTIGAVGLLALVLTIAVLFRAMKRVAQVAASLPPALTMGHASIFTDGTQALGEGEMPTGRLLGALERLEKRIQDMESRALISTSNGANGNGNGKHRNGDAHSDGTVLDADRPAVDEKTAQVTLLLGKGQALLHMNKVEAAVECFDEVIALDPTNSEALVKKGSALEKLKKLEDAIQCYDKAIALNGSLTLAYLYKGGVFNQLERFSEALECYEQALRTQQKAAAPELS